MMKLCSIFTFPKGKYWIILGFILFNLKFTASRTNIGFDVEKCFTEGNGLILPNNIEKFRGCKSINGNITIHGNSFKNVDLYKLEIFSTVKSITGFLNIENTHSDLKNLSFFRNLEVIGQTSQNDAYALNVYNTSLESLGLLALKRIKGVGVAIIDNPNLCFINTFDWENMMDSDANLVQSNNCKSKDSEDLGLTCDSECNDGCWGSGPDKCVRCKNYQQGNKCVDACDKSMETCRKGCPSNMFAKNDECLPCDEQCLGCNDTIAKDCTYCKNENGEEQFNNDDSITEVFKGNILHFFWMILALIITSVITFSITMVYHDKLIRYYKSTQNDISNYSHHYDEIQTVMEKPCYSNITVHDICYESDEIFFGNVEFYRKGSFGRLYRTFAIDQTGKYNIIQVLDKSIINDVSDFQIRVKKINNMKHDYLLIVNVFLPNPEHIRLITELVPLGSILSHIRQNKDLIRSIEVLKWCYQVSVGMRYLEENGIVHGNLAARTILYDSDRNIKIKDFGRLYLIGESYQTRKWFNCCRHFATLDVEEGKCPLKHNFNHKFDVWSFGLTMYELLTYGQNPWEHILYNYDEQSNELKWETNFSLPKICKHEMYAVMEKCWHKDENMRPNFKALSDNLKEAVDNPIEYIFTFVM